MVAVMTQHEVARELGISQARVLQLEQSAFRKLRNNPEARLLLSMVRFEPRIIHESESKGHENER